MRWRWMAVCFISCLLLQYGCGGAATDSNDSESNTADNAENQTDSDHDADNADDQLNEPTRIKEREFTGGGSTQSGLRPTLGGAQAIERLTQAIHEMLEIGPANVVWMWDSSATAAGFNESLRHEVRRFYEALQDETNGSRLSTGIVAFDSTPHFVVEEPSNDIASILESLDGLSFDADESPDVYAAIAESVSHYVSSNAAQNADFLFICLTNQQGQSFDQIDAAADALAGCGYPLFVVGLPAPFGRVGTESSRSMMSRSSSDDAGLRVGPETCRPERINLAFPTTAEQAFWLDSGFGPWGLERLARLNGGRYLIVRDFDIQSSGGLMAAEWPRRSSRRFSASTMSQYRPDYDSVEDYLTAVNESAMRRALVAASELPPTEVLTNFTLEFDARDPARLVNQISMSQREPARVLPRLEALRDAILPGEADRDLEQNRRWQASYDLAIGRILAAHTRADGYNSLLADLKLGRNFADPASDSWVLEPSKYFDDGGSSVKTASRKAVEYLERVIAEHPDTPWAYLAEQELSQPIGWTLTEADRFPDE